MKEGSGQFFNAVTQEVDEWAVKHTLLQLKVELVISKALKDLHNVMVMFIQVTGVDQDIINVDDDKPLAHVSEYLVHGALED